MSKESLFKHIRSQDVVFWAGAGFSHYAGYPLGGELGGVLYNALSKTERHLLKADLPLQDLAEEFVRIKNDSRNELLQLVRDVFSKQPTDLKDHQALTAIPQFKTIVTTNYDRLFEQAYGDNGNLIIREKDISLLHRSKVNIIKIHGDLSDLSTLILTRGDYNNFYKQDWSSPFWAHLATLMATKVMLFVGYSIEDHNVQAMLKHVSKYLKEMKKEAFFVAPHIPDHQVAHLARLGIETIKMKGADLLSEIESDLRMTIFGDQRKRRVDTDTFNNYFFKKQLVPTFENTANGVEVTGLNDLDGKPVGGLMHLSFKEDVSQKKLYEAFAKGEIHSLVIKPEMLKGFSIDFAGMRFLNLDEMEKVEVNRPPTIHTFDLSFPGLNLELEGLTASVLKGRNAVVKCTIHNLDIELKLKLDGKQKPEVALDITRNPVHKSVKAGLDAYQFVTYFFEQKIFAIHLANGNTIKSKSTVLNKTYVKEAKAYLDYFKLMKKVEDFFGVRFREITDLNEENFKTLKRLSRITDGKSFDFATGALKLTMSEITKESLELYERLETEDAPFDIQFKTNETVDIHGVNIALERQRLHVPSAQILNLDTLKKGKTRSIEMKSKTDKIYSFYHEKQDGE